jgi:hypothetical protein
LDLTGVPPTLAEVDAFVEDKAADAYERALRRNRNQPRLLSLLRPWYRLPVVPVGECLRVGLICRSRRCPRYRSLLRLLSSLPLGFFTNPLRFFTTL